MTIQQKGEILYNYFHRKFGYPEVCHILIPESKVSLMELLLHNFWIGECRQIVGLLWILFENEAGVQKEKEEYFKTHKELFPKS